MFGVTLRKTNKVTNEPRDERRGAAAVGQSSADAVLADNRRCHYGGLLVPVGALSRVPND
jgi:hypothetical protein